MENIKKIIIVAGPCVVESFELLDEVAAELKKICDKHAQVDFYFKSSYRKANRSSVSSFTGVGDEKALGWLADIKEKYKVPIVTDVHSVYEAEQAAKYVDVLQIPAFLSRQTDLILAAAKTNKRINIKKAQFMAPNDMKKAVEKSLSVNNDKIWLTERGTFFGYHDLVVDFRSILIMRRMGYPVLYDATHSLQQPSIGVESGGCREFIPALAKAAVAVGVDGIFFETHPNPEAAKSDAATQVSLSMAEELIETLLRYHNI